MFHEKHLPHSHSPSGRVASAASGEGAHRHVIHSPMFHVKHLRAPVGRSGTPSAFPRELTASDAPPVSRTNVSRETLLNFTLPLGGSDAQRPHEGAHQFGIHTEVFHVKYLSTCGASVQERFPTSTNVSRETFVQIVHDRGRLRKRPKCRKSFISNALRVIHEGSSAGASSSQSGGSAGLLHKLVAPHFADAIVYFAFCTLLSKAGALEGVTQVF